MNNAERMHKAYKKQCQTTLIAFGLITLMTHIFPMYFLFPELNQMTIFGFPADYWLTLVIGWLVLISVFWIYIEVSEKVNQAIDDSSSGAADVAPGGNP